LFEFFDALRSSARNSFSVTIAFAQIFIYAPRAMLEDIRNDAYRSEAATLGQAWLPCRQTLAHHGRTGFMPALAGGAQA
jgi:hypothetical protein